MANDEVSGLAYNSKCTGVIHIGIQRDQRLLYRIVQTRSLYVVMISARSINGDLCHHSHTINLAALIIGG